MIFYRFNYNKILLFGDFIENHTLYEESSTLLRNLGQVLPSRLEYLCLALSFIKSDLEIFLKNSQNTFIKKLLINNVFLHTSSPRSEDTKSDSNGGIQPVELFFLIDEEPNLLLQRKNKQEIFLGKDNFETYGVEVIEEALKANEFNFDEDSYKIKNLLKELPTYGVLYKREVNEICERNEANLEEILYEAINEYEEILISKDKIDEIELFRDINISFK
ncbi:hypothetical protein GLOIN_2v1774336 [Rhizophagus irregularis DAOM 181602=DAOM 197198]|uniref:Uncharacterized protein n=1 Tax=Rhizophagus irregularis (strain DAOM 181602 / DAOM 197198 / MUCL 43194) TaxID=747089 RepID=A0A2P4Q2A5_RHIID|nr:hypothetical protein GLOIN_2v1774336 [Rhizophagus irregularis DAOM 181602=DAOM 197198]POG71793.1 hypothetical protein GLOIN_2v1774336 [Rhizophagus irregularis DAOM 181602=DAOM 197198]GET67182.1 hypothetical protein GLOIN_2v1774336 [Rhizophagus irregularis DAOM 181602=DAOM 197198]|eukprot:XP_025178659.1 hypothetical protein GLOIN_2v1774336 [Rhizophagus irregularis DAOM 181602=DAOM 197198]